jgi:hypothetical protein
MKELVVALVILLTGSSSCSAPSPEVTSMAATGSSYAAGTAPGSVALADLNVDGKPDIIVANEQSNDVTILLGDGKGGFIQAKGSPFPAGHLPNDIAIGDFNGDGKLDLAFPNHDTKYVTVLLGDGQGRFKPAPNSPFTVQSKPHPHGIAAGDLNGDQYLDLVVESWGINQVEVLFGDGKGGFVTPGSLFAVGKMPYQRVRVGDVNNDGKLDIITTNLEGNNVTVLLGEGKGGFNQAKGSPFPAGVSPWFVAIDDLNRDRKPDLIIAPYAGGVNDPSHNAVTILLGDGNGGFKIMDGSPFPTGSYPNMLAIGDINGDGIPDIAVSNTESNNITILLGNNKGTVTPSATITVGRQPKGIAVADLNGDGKADIVVANNGDNNITVILSKSQKIHERRLGL